MLTLQQATLRSEPETNFALMPLPFAIPFVPILKLLALGSIKTILLFIGALVVPRWTLRLMIKGAAGIVLPVGEWLLERDKVDADTVASVQRELDVMLDVDYTREEARAILMSLVRKTVKSMVSTTANFVPSTMRFFKRLFSPKTPPT